MPTKKQEPATRKTVKKSRLPAKTTEQTKTGGRGLFYRIEVRPHSEFITFRTHDVGEKGHVERLAGKRADGSWDTVTWLVSKKDAHVTSGGELVIDEPGARTIVKQLRGKIIHKKGNVFEAQLRKDVQKKPTPAETKKGQPKKNSAKP